MMEYINYYEINIIQSFFLICAFMIIFLGVLIQTLEPYLPKLLIQAFNYGKHQKETTRISLVNIMEVPKSWFRHFYIIAVCLMIPTLLLMFKGIIMKETAPDFVINLLDIIGGGNKRQVEVNSSSGIISLFLLTMQACRRFYETNFIQIFSKKSKINIQHYVVGVMHYVMATAALVANTEGFVRGTIPSSFSLSNATLMQYLCIFIFYFSWSNQYKSNMILANLRKDETGRVVTDRHFIPKGGFFYLISSPHMFLEIAMYIAMIAMVPNCKNWYFVALWVTSNQIIVGYQTHQWYKQTYKNYPKDRYAILPYIL